MAYNGNTQCGAGTCLDGFVHTDLTCPTYSDFIADYNAKITAIAAAICCVEKKIKQKHALMRVGDGQTDAPVTIGAYSPIKNFTLVEEVDPDNVFTFTPDGATVNVTGIYGFTAQVNALDPTPGGFHLAADNIFINGAIAIQQNPDGETSFTNNSSVAINRMQILNVSYLKLDAGQTITIGARSDSHSLSLRGEYHISLISEII